MGAIEPRRSCYFDFWNVANVSRPCFDVSRFQKLEGGGDRPQAVVAAWLHRGSRTLTWDPLARPRHPPAHLSLHSLLLLPSVHAEVEEPRCHCCYELAELMCHHHRASAPFRLPKAPLQLPLPRPPLSWANHAEVRAHSSFSSLSAMDIAHQSATVIVVGFTGASFRPSPRLPVFLVRA
jgi:hypothetical protein